MWKSVFRRTVVAVEKVRIEFVDGRISRKRVLTPYPGFVYSIFTTLRMEFISLFRRQLRCHAGPNEIRTRRPVQYAAPVNYRKKAAGYVLSCFPSPIRHNYRERAFSSAILLNGNVAAKPSSEINGARSTLTGGIRCPFFFFFRFILSFAIRAVLSSTPVGYVNIVVYFHAVPLPNN